MLNVHRNRKSYQETGEKRVWRWGEREIIYLLLHCHHQNVSCIQMGSDESHFNVSLIVRDKVRRQCPQRAEADLNRGPSTYQPNALLLDQTSSLPNKAGKRPLITIHFSYVILGCCWLLLWAGQNYQMVSRGHINCDSCFSIDFSSS